MLILISWINKIKWISSNVWIISFNKVFIWKIWIRLEQGWQNHNRENHQFIKSDKQTLTLFVLLSSYGWIPQIGSGA